MLEAPRPADETARLRSLRSLAILDTEFESRFDRITRIAAAALDVPIALVSLVDANRQWFKSCVGLGARETPRSVSFCGHAISSDEVFVIEDAHHDERFSDNPLVVGEPFVRFYAGQPLDDGAGHKLGTLCLIDRRPRSLSTTQIGLLQELGRWAEEELRSNGLDHALIKQRDTERRLEAIAATLLDGLVTTDAEGRIKSLNPAAERIFGYERVEAIGRNLSMLLDDPVFPEPADAVDEPGRHRAAGAGREVVGRRKDGSRFPLELSLSRVGSGENQVLLGITRDISDRRNAEEALRRSEELHRSVINAMKEGICIRDGSGAVVASNPAAAEILGVTTAQVDGRAPMDPRWRTLHEDGTPFPEAAHPAKVAAATGQPCTGVVMGVHTPDDRLRWIEVDAQPLLRDGSAEPWAVVSTFSDVTDRRAIDRMKSEFVSVVSHELRTPLTSIRGALGLLASGGLGTVPDKAQRMLDIAVANTDRLIRLINDILDIERIESGKTNLTKALCDAAELIGNAVEVMRPMAETAEVTLAIDTHSTMLWVDPDRIMQTLTNLISNAVKFSAPGSVVLVGVEVRDGAATFRVTDHGRGVPKDKRETIFERFQQVDASDSRDKGGTGLGLAICRSIVEQHGGRIWVEETDGGGSTFVFSVPTSAGTVTAVKPSPPPPRVADGPREQRRADHVLVVEDDPHLGEVLNGSLEKHGVTTFTVGTIAAAKAAIEKSPPAMILLDLGLPDGDGTELLVWLGEQRYDPGIPIIVYTEQHLSAAHRELILLHHAEIHTKGRTDTETLATMVARHHATNTVRAMGETA